MKKTSLLFVLIIGLLLSSCAILDSGGKSSLDGSSWSLISYANQSLIPGTTMTASFEKKEVSGSASCNHYFGSYSSKGNQIEIGGLGWTEMACMDPEGIMEQEQEIMRLMADAASFIIQESDLIIKSSDGEILIFSQNQDID